MCGITAVFNLDSKPINRKCLELMTGLLGHRGPDAADLWVDRAVGLGHRRLSVIDLEGGAQPMCSPDGRYVLSYNGEIFNYREVRQNLIERGVVFRTESDTEALLWSLILDGAASLSALNGQFAFVFYDTKERVAVVARDRMGEKPLYYWHSDASFVIASELKPVLYWLRRIGIEPEIDRDALRHYFAFNYVPLENTLVRNVKCLTPGHYIVLSGESFEMRGYWTPATPELAVSESGRAEQFAELLSDATRIRLRSDVPLGVFLSGGIDSAAVLTGAAQHDTDLRAYTVDFRPASFSEVSRAKVVTEALGIEHKILALDLEREDLTQLLPKLVYHADEPLADSSALAVYLLCRNAREHITVALSGDGGDELFAGYNTNRATLAARSIPSFVRGLVAPLSRFVRPWVSDANKVGSMEVLERFLRNLDLPPGAAHFAWNGMFRRKEQQCLLASGLARSNDADSFCEIAAALGVDLQAPVLTQLLLADQANYLCNDILAKVDRMSMAHGLEVRSVLMDHRIVEFSRALLALNLIAPRNGKRYLESVLRSHVSSYPPSYRKQGFSIPVHGWMRGQLREFVGDLLHSDVVERCGWFEPRYVRELWEQHQSGCRSIGFELWGVMVSLLWYQGVFAVDSGLSQDKDFSADC